MAPFALFGIDNDGLGIVLNLLVIFLIAIWLALVFWAYNDAKRRLDDSVLVGSAAFAALVFPFAGALVYAIVRPPETLDDRYERELDIRAGELRVRILEQAAKSGAGSSSFATAVAGELAGETGARRAAAGRGGQSAQSAPPPRKPDRTPAAERQAAARPSKATRPSAEEPRRRPAS
jgi:hypothetical protein